MSGILLVGVGGQGTILASKLLTLGLLAAGGDVKMSEIHGMSQRGGSVSSHIRYGRSVWSPVIELGGADLLVAFEKMEALRWLEYLRPGGSVVVGDCRINPLPVLGGQAVYPDNLIEILREKAETVVIDAQAEAQKLGHARVMNMLLLGAAVKRLGLTGLDWAGLIRENVKPALVELNIRALARGQELA